MVSRSIALLLCAVHLGCAEPEPGPQGPAGAAGKDGAPGKDAVTAGSRLKPVYEAGEDGSKAYQPGTWWDSVRGEECARALASDGMYRCLPMSRERVVDTAMPSYYSDPACAVPLASFPQGCSPAYGTQILSVTDCGPKGFSRIYPLTPATVAMEYAVDPATMMCNGYPASPKRDYSLIGGEVAPGEFEAIDRAHD